MANSKTTAKFSVQADDFSVHVLLCFTFITLLAKHFLGLEKAGGSSCKFKSTQFTYTPEYL